MSDWWLISAWREPAWLAVLLLPVLAAFWPARRRTDSVPLGPAFVLASLPPEPRLAPRLAALLRAAGLVAFALAMARPVWREALPPEREGVEIVLVLDRSSSMEARDLDPTRTRLEVAVDAARAFVAARTTDRIGLIAFARYPDLLSPTSLDQASVQELLGEIDAVEADGPEDLTGIGAAVARAAQVLEPRSARSKIIVLLTDGEENVATPAEPGSLQPLEAAALCRAWGVRVYPVAVAAGDPDALTELARATGGRAFAAADAGALDAVFAAVDRLEKSPLAESREREHERFPLLLGLGLLLLTGGWLLRRGPAEVLP